MKKKLHLFILFFLSSLTYAQTTYVGNVVDERKNPIVGCEVKNTTTNVSVVTDDTGKFSLPCSKGDEIVISVVNYQILQFTFKDKKNPSVIGLKKSELLNFYNSTDIDGEISPKNYWIGARVGYNFVSNSNENNFIGSANAGINVRKFGDISSLAVIGNVGNYKFNTDEEEANELQQLAQSSNGISVGLAYMEDYKDVLLDDIDFTWYVSTRARFNTYKNVGINKESINLPQFVFTVGVEFALAKFEKGGELTFTQSASALAFDKNQYNLIFGSTRGGLGSLDSTLILPLKDNVGFFVSGTFAQKTSALFTFGIILK
ncbi:carboxypeptidase-like regulatory domain-containing protein [Flavobacterium sp. 3-210]